MVDPDDGFAKLARGLREVASEKLPKAILKVAKAGAITGERLAKENATTSPRVRSGRLRSSIQGTVPAPTDTSTTIELRAGGGSKDVTYARMQEEGGTQRPKKSRYLTIPMGKAKTKAGVHRYPSARAVPGLFVFKAKSGLLYLGKRAGSKKKPRIEAWYRLIESTKITGKRYMGRAVDDVNEVLTREIGGIVGVMLEGVT